MLSLSLSRSLCVHRKGLAGFSDWLLFSYEDNLLLFSYSLLFPYSFEILKRLNAWILLHDVWTSWILTYMRLNINATWHSVYTLKCLSWRQMDFKSSRNQKETKKKSNCLQLYLTWTRFGARRDNAKATQQTLSCGSISEQSLVDLLLPFAQNQRNRPAWRWRVRLETHSSWLWDVPAQPSH